MPELIAVNLLIGDRTYRLKISAAEEEFIRKITKTINEKIIEFKTQFAGKDMQDYIAMVLIWLATEQNAVENEQGIIKEASVKIKQLENMIDKALQE